MLSKVARSYIVSFCVLCKCLDRERTNFWTAIIVFLCNSVSEEISFHLFFECPFSNSCWNPLSIHCDLSLQSLDMMIEARTTFGSLILREIVIMACWAIWTTSNGVIFDNKSYEPTTFQIGKSHSKKSGWFVSKPSRK